MSEMKIEPAEGYVALEFIEDEPESRPSPQAGSGASNETCFAVCVGVGKKVTVCKTGDTVVVRSYARENGLKISDDVSLVEAYLVVGTVAK